MAKPFVPHEGPIIARVEAKALGLTRFFTGKPCKHGHLGERTTCNGACIQCNAIATLFLYHSESEEKRAKRRVRGVAFAATRRTKNRVYGIAYGKTDDGKRKKSAWKKANRKRLNILSAEARKRNPEAAKVRNARHYRTAKGKATHARYAQSPKGKLNILVSSHRRRAQMASAEGSHTPEEILALFEQHGGQCAYCKASIADRYHVDHVIPLAQGGTNWITNIVLACPPCNLSKNRFSAEAFLRRLNSNQETHHG